MRLPEDDFFERAGAWLLYSGIQDAAGGVARHYRTNEQRNSPISTEITGYAASALAYFAHISGAPEYRARAGKTAEYLTEYCWNPTLRVFPFEVEDGNSRLAYFFDTGIIIRGLLSALRVDPQPKWRTVAFEAAVAMRDVFQGEPVVELPTLKALPRAPRWSRQPGCYQLKSALAWHELGGFESEWLRSLAAAKASAATFLADETEPTRLMDRLHAYCYYLEALLFADDSSAELARGIALVSEHLRSAEGGFVRSDVYAQLLRLRLYAAARVPLDRDACLHEATALAHFQVTDPDRRIHGGFWFGSNGETLLPFVNPVSTIFAVQALYMWSEWTEGRREWPLEDLI